jgi:hypothetical protein
MMQLGCGGFIKRGQEGSATQDQVLMSCQRSAAYQQDKQREAVSGSSAHFVHEQALLTVSQRSGQPSSRTLKLLEGQAPTPRRLQNGMTSRAVSKSKVSGTLFGYIQRWLADLLANCLKHWSTGVRSGDQRL